MLRITRVCQLTFTLSLVLPWDYSWRTSTYFELYYEVMPTPSRFSHRLLFIYPELIAGPFINLLFLLNIRLRVRHHLEKDITNPTQLAVVVGKCRFTFKRSNVHHVDTRTRKRGVIIGVRRRKEGVQLVREGWDTWKLLQGGLRMILEKEHRRRNKPQTKHGSN